MSQKKTVEDIKKQVYENSLHTCEYIEGEAKAGSKIHVKCLIHGNDFWVSYDTIRKASRKHHICPVCKQEDNRKDQVKLVCDYCGTEYSVPKSKIRSEFHFCCRECKDKAQRVHSGGKFDALRPDHYGNGQTAYRDLAFSLYPHKCAVCGWDEDEDILEVHHIDANRDNNAADNLIILCPTCHKKLTLHKYYLKDRTSIIKK